MYFSIGSKQDKLYRGGSGPCVFHANRLMVGTGTDYDDIYVLPFLENYVLHPQALVKHHNQGILMENSPCLVKKILYISNLLEIGLSIYDRPIITNDINNAILNRLIILIQIYQLTISDHKLELIHYQSKYNVLNYQAHYYKS
jgi:hypothetical protein